MNHKKRIQGVVVSDKADKTITVQVSTYKVDKIYKKRVQAKSKFYAHDEKNEAKVGDLVTIEESRPLSAKKRWKLVSIDEKHLEDIKVLEEKEVEEALGEETSTKEE